VADALQQRRPAGYGAANSPGRVSSSFSVRPDAPSVLKSAPPNCCASSRKVGSSILVS